MIGIYVIAERFVARMSAFRDDRPWEVEDRDRTRHERHRLGELAVVRAAARHAYPTADIDAMLGKIRQW
jgi:hypothetical protein